MDKQSESIFSFFKGIFRVAGRRERTPLCLPFPRFAGKGEEMQPFPFADDRRKGRSTLPSPLREAEGGVGGGYFRRRIGKLSAMLLLAAGLALPALAAPTQPAPLDVAQTPSIYAQKGIAPNLFLLLDDSGSMQYEYLGSKGNDIGDYRYGFPPGRSEPYGGSMYCDECAPGFEADDEDAAQYRSSFVNPNYYNPAITYTPWACAAPYPQSENQKNTDPADIVNPVTGETGTAGCGWDKGTGLWVMNNADPGKVYLSPVRTDEGFRSINVWNDSNDDNNDNPRNGYVVRCVKTVWWGCKKYSYAGFWPATYFNYLEPGQSDDYEDTYNYQRVQVCPSTSKENSEGVWSGDVCTPPPPLPTNPEPYHTYTDASGNYVYIKANGKQVMRTPHDELVNFANWYQYYRSHVLATKAGVGIAFMKIPSGFRVDYGVINTMDSEYGDPILENTEDFTSSRRLKFLQKLYDQPNPSGVSTPNRRALKHVGDWFAENPDDGAPWGNSTAEAKNASAPLSCRANYVILATDGQWNGGDSGVGNEDGSPGDTITDDAGHSFKYEAHAPYEDDESDTLADVAMKYWKNDLQDMDNTVPPNGADPAFWQHLVTFTVGLGVQSTLVQDYIENHPDKDKKAAQADVLQEIIDGSKDWPTAYSHKIDDTWHAAVDGHGTFASAGNPTELYKAISNALINIVNRTGAASSLSVNTEQAGQTGTDQQIYQALFHPHGWWGDVKALPVMASTQHTGGPSSSTTRNVVTISPDAVWSASCVLTGGQCDQMKNSPTVTRQPVSQRTYLTWNNGSGDVFDTSLPSAALSAIGGTAVVKYVRGVRSVEADNGGTLRNRSSVMGDVVKSSPVYVGAPNESYPDTWTNLLWPSKTPNENGSGQKYSDFVSNHQSRKPMVYVGANDGMLHGFFAPQDKTTTHAGWEQLAYVPRAVYSNLRDYASQTYGHHYFVDATPGAGDLFYGGQWHTWLVGGEGAGGNSIFALDITDPGSLGPSDVIGEWGPDNICARSAGYCHGDDLGLTFGEPVITRFNNGQWGFVFGNGFDSDSGVAAIFIGIVDSSSGQVTFHELSTGYGPDEDPTGKDRPNGIAYVTPVDFNGDHTTDYVYAGDYFGNVWRFNLTSQYEGSWGAEYGSAGAKVPMFTATNASGKAQPITTKLLVLAVPGAGAGFRVMVEFGTGSDVTKAQQAPNTKAGGVQSLYGVWDWDLSQWNKGEPTPGMSARTPVAFQYASLPSGPVGGSGGSFNRLKLGKQSVTHELDPFPGNDLTTHNRVVSNNVLCWVDMDPSVLPSACGGQATDYGWRLALLPSSATPQGEKVVYSPTLRSGVFVVNTTIPNSSSGLTCQAQAFTGWTMALDPETGGRLSFEAFDTKGNGQFEKVKIGGDTVPTSGITIGAVGSPGFITYKGDTFLISNTGSGKPTASPINLGAGNLAVQISWQELR